MLGRPQGPPRVNPKQDPSAGPRHYARLIKRPPESTPSSPITSLPRPLVTIVDPSFRFLPWPWWQLAYAPTRALIFQADAEGVDIQVYSTVIQLLNDPEVCISRKRNMDVLKDRSLLRGFLGRALPSSIYVRDLPPPRRHKVDECSLAYAGRRGAEVTNRHLEVL
ncbi:hypothetical protein NMY22_g12785 [Coprinellus aureogranulatus]|nr:hypothetical protein NMY22_g12785 [Coprinellus aureogranulatus]